MYLNKSGFHQYWGGKLKNRNSYLCVLGLCLNKDENGNYIGQGRTYLSEAIQRAAEDIQKKIDDGEDVLLFDKLEEPGGYPRALGYIREITGTTVRCEVLYHVGRLLEEAKMEGLEYKISFNCKAEVTNNMINKLFYTCFSLSATPAKRKDK